MFNVKLQRKASIGLFDDRFKQWATAIKTPQAPVNDVAKLNELLKLYISEYFVRCLPQGLPGEQHSID